MLQEEHNETLKFLSSTSPGFDTTYVKPVVMEWEAFFVRPPLRSSR